MDVALELSRKCPPVKTAYSVGCVLMDGAGQVLSTGYSREAGNDHAEQVCLRKCPSRVPSDLHMYCTMEPCGHRNSGNKCCADRIAEWLELHPHVHLTVYYCIAEPPTLVQDTSGLGKLRAHPRIRVVHLPALQGKLPWCCVPLARCSTTPCAIEACHQVNRHV